MTKKALVSLLLIGVLMFGVGMGTYAWFTSTVTSEGNEISSGTIKLAANEGGVLPVADFGKVNMQPGDVSGEEVVVEIENDGTLDLAWFGKFEVSGNDADKLPEAIYVDYAKMEFLDEDGTWGIANEYIVNGVGAGPYGDWYTDNLVDSELGVITLANFLNTTDMTPEAPGYQMGALIPGNKYRFTFKLGFAPLAGNEYQGLGAPTFTSSNGAVSNDAFAVKYVIKATQVNADAINNLNIGVNGATHLDWLNDQIIAQEGSPQQ